MHRPGGRSQGTKPDRGADRSIELRPHTGGCPGVNHMATETKTRVEGLIINGERANASDGRTFEVYDPSSGDVLASAAKATKADGRRAVQSGPAALAPQTWGGIAAA